MSGKTITALPTTKEAHKASLSGIFIARIFLKTQA
jgi:hypothetical protein